MPFKPGQSGNPAGRPKGSRNVLTVWREALTECVTRDDVRAVFAALLKAARAGKPWAVKELFDRCAGRPQQSMEIFGGLTLAEWIAKEEGQENGDNP